MIAWDQTRRLETNPTVTLVGNFWKCEQAGRIDDFLKAFGRLAAE